MLVALCGIEDLYSASFFTWSRFTITGGGNSLTAVSSAERARGEKKLQHIA